ncbi:SlyX family protein [Pontibaca methylaminivorans]|uniref:SlyX protein n=1 Tax=Pontibaca methylaminivorans TaxID=515897 RepID=A0A1R3WHA2_9RHOB|nr:SlyX family protein [Pontibaca methylaminivorans]SIT77490.1 SlyX protein [Pontibaca methylaminivorans]
MPQSAQKIEETLAHLSREVEDLSGIVASQADEIARLRRQVGLLLERESEREAAAGGGVILGDERPPHY